MGNILFTPKLLLINLSVYTVTLRFWVESVIEPKENQNRILYNYIKMLLKTLKNKL